MAALSGGKCKVRSTGVGRESTGEGREDSENGTRGRGGVSQRGLEGCAGQWPSGRVGRCPQMKTVLVQTETLHVGQASRQAFLKAPHYPADGGTNQPRSHASPPRPGQRTALSCADGPQPERLDPRSPGVKADTLTFIVLLLCPFIPES